MSSKIRILNVYYKEDFILENKYIIPIHAGKSLSDKDLGMLGDDSGINISEENPFFSEFTAMYWEWKNNNSEYVGLMHYRRQLDFSCDEYYQEYPDLGDYCYYDYPSKDLLTKLSLNNEEKIEEVITSCDVLMPFPLENNKKDCSTNYEQYCAYENHYKEDLDMAFSLIEKQSPYMKKYVDDYFFNKNKNGGHFGHVFVMRRDLFNRYCEWFFPLIFKIKENIDFKDLTFRGTRAAGFIGERMLNVFLLYLKDTDPSLKFRYVPYVFWKRTDLKSNPLPFFGEDSLNIAYSSDNKYLPIVSVSIESLIKTTPKDKNLDILILCDDIEEKNKSNLIQFYKERKNVKIRFIPALPYLYDFPLLLEMKKKKKLRYPVNVFYKALVPFVLENYKKVIFLDGDTIVSQNIETLFNDPSLEGYHFGAVLDIVMRAWTSNPELKNKVYPNIKSTWSEYLEKVGLKDLHKYFNTGVLYFNNVEMKKKGIDALLFRELNRKIDYLLPDQDLLNLVMNSEPFGEINFKWNFFPKEEGEFKSILEDSISLQNYNLYNKSSKDIGIIHYAVWLHKPWFFPEEEKAMFFWIAARNSAFYEVLIKRMAHDDCKRVASEKLSIKRAIRSFLRRVKSKLKRLFY